LFCGVYGKQIRHQREHLRCRAADGARHFGKRRSILENSTASKSSGHGIGKGAHTEDLAFQAMPNDVQDFIFFRRKEAQFLVGTGGNFERVLAIEIDIANGSTG
jgi:hypothetical protein